MYNDFSNKKNEKNGGTLNVFTSWADDILAVRLIINTNENMVQEAADTGK